MENWGIDEYICAVIVGCALLFFARGVPRLLEETSRARRREAEAALEAAWIPDWSSLSDYGELADAASAKAHGLSTEEFLDGPFRRFLEICSDPDGHPRARARAMEFGRAALAGYRDSQSEMDPADLQRRARSMAAEWFGRPEIPDGDYMLEVFDGISNHNYRGKRDMCGAIET